jgi:hypothetical protein
MGERLPDWRRILFVILFLSISWRMGMINPDFDSWVSLFLVVTSFTVASLGLGAVDRTFMQPSWVSAIIKTQGQLEQSNCKLSPRSFIACFLAALLIAFILTLLITCLGIKTLTGGVAIGFLAWLGLVAISIMKGHGLRRIRSLLTVIDPGYWLAVLVIQGVLISALSP